MARYHDTPTRRAAANAENHRQEHSLYLPLHPNAKPTRKASVSKHDEKAKKEREAAALRASVDPYTGKRRGTMRSKVNDEELEQLKRAIEESKREGEGGTDGSKRNGKRGRDDSSEEYVRILQKEDSRLTGYNSSNKDNKRQRRTSDSVQAAKDDDSDDAAAISVSKTKKAKAEAAMSARQAEQDKKDKERDKARTEAAGRRQERARSRRNDGELEATSSLKTEN